MKNNEFGKEEFQDEIAAIANEKAAKILETFICHDCHIEKPVQKNGGTGYGRDKDNNLICYDCCGIRDKKEMQETGKFVGYISKDKDDKWYFTNWPGTLKIPAYVEKSNHNWRFVQRTNVWFHFEGFRWFGTNIGDSQICRAKKTKVKS